MEIISGDDDLLLIADNGLIIRLEASKIPVYGRASQGVILMRMDEGVKVISITKTEKADSPDDEEEAQNDAETEI